VVHRVYRLSPSDALRRFGAEVASYVPEGGLVDVHRYCVIRIGDTERVLDVTFPEGSRWSGRASMELPCGPGMDHPVTDDTDAAKRGLQERHCDPSVREPFIAALARRQEQDSQSVPATVHRG
jgi:hypothetical protein